MASASTITQAPKAYPSITYVDEGVDDDPVINDKPKPPDLWEACHSEVQTKSKAVHKVLKVIRPEPILIHQNMIIGYQGLDKVTLYGYSCWLVIFIMVVAYFCNLGNPNVQHLGELPIYLADDHLVGSSLVVAI
ncbi:uncharacterized protein LOC18426557 isoform X2 [Amborella trichopoda]|uniref:Uncharacterized protein n=1 Tax=Amborella trichopoda TaxID=13333 RepID=W1NPE6_AMBTC|nr:uncharacterized protein LOC18426557 isoform X2 [Amborella trichopoda]ERM98541.1 hypothetical protein AMTR_s00113p00145520 [Amborella trichopoda]|eukprot:XP_006833263.1 uncharacterized protein LOC18426557 isoform X2 [Amborella trichopoda]